MRGTLQALGLADVMDEGITEDRRATAEAGRKIRERRDALRWTLSQLADAAGVDRSHLSKLENGKLPSIRRSTLGAIEAALDRAEQEGLDDPVVLGGEGQYVKFGFGDAYVEGTVRNAEERAELEAAFTRLLRLMRGESNRNQG